MGNPHPTKSKPIKIGRKHTQGERVRQRAKREKGARIVRETIVAKRKKIEAKIRSYWSGDTDVFPSR